MSDQRPGGQSGPRVSVIIPAYRAAGTVCRAIDSVLGQKYSELEIIVVDDGSPDEQAAVVLQTYGTKVTLLRRSNGGAASARNAGLDRATGDYVAFLDADDYWEADKLAVQLQLFDRYPELQLVAGSYFEETPGTHRLDVPVLAGPRSWYDRVVQCDGARAFRLATMVWTSTVLSRREPLERERFDPHLVSCHDRDLWVRLVPRKAVYLISRPLATAVLVRGSISRSRASVDRDNINMLHVIEKSKGLLGPIAYRAWRSHTLYRWAVDDPEPRSALPRLVRSVLLWPLPFAGVASCPPLGRVRRMAVLLAAAIGLRKTHTWEDPPGPDKKAVGV